MVLLEVLSELSRQHHRQLRVAHLNHQLRGRSSDADEALVRKAAKKLGLPVVVARRDVRAFAQNHGLSLEMAARQLRHDFLARSARQSGIRTIALAHHADDQIELFFLRLFRGSGSEGLAGMKWRGASPSDPTIGLVRPLLDRPKEALLEYARKRRVQFREDASNASLDIQRNRIRHELLPLLQDRYQPALSKTILRVMNIVEAEADAIARLAADWLRTRAENPKLQIPISKSPKLERAGFRGRQTKPFESLPVAVQRRCIQLQLVGSGIAPDFDLVEELRLHRDRAVTVRRDKDGRRAGEVYLATRDKHGQVAVKEQVSFGFNTESRRVILGQSAGQVIFGDKRVRWQIRPQEPGSKMPRKRKNCEFFDAAKVRSPILLRHWQPGDRFQPIGMAQTLKLQDLFTNRKVARNLRHERLVGVTAGGEIFWVEGERISERFKLTDGTSRCLQWCWQGKALNSRVAVKGPAC